MEKINQESTHMNNDTKQTKPRWMFGLFAGLFSSSTGTWVPMRQLVRFSSVAAWMLAYGMVAYGVFTVVEMKSFPALSGIELVVGAAAMLVLAWGSFWGFLKCGGRKYDKYEKGE